MAFSVPDSKSCDPFDLLVRTWLNLNLVELSLVANVIFRSRFLFDLDGL